jgi:hypothetical protein
MVWIVGAICMILFGGGIGLVGFSLGMSGYTILGGIMLLYGLFLLVSIGRHSRYWGAKRT